MRRESWSRVFDLFRQVVALDADERERFLRAHCENAEERRQVERLLSEDAREKSPLDRSPAVSLSQVVEGPSSVQLGGRIGAYVVRRVIGSGGMSTVYEAEQETPRRLVALKTLRAGFLSESGLHRFRMEAEILGSLHHPSIAEIYESGTHEADGGRIVPYIAMEYVREAKDLLRFAHGLDRRARLQLFHEVCEAVHYGHRRGVIHRDLKPSNILIDQNGRPKVIDFGLARVTDHELIVLSSAHTESGRTAGTLLYMSPEQLLGIRDSIDVRSDVYALGVVLFQLLSAQTPFALEGLPFAQLTLTLARAEPRRLGELDESLRGDLEWITAKALERDPDHRYASVQELAGDIRRHLEHEPVIAGPPSGWYRMRKLVRRHRLGFGVAALVGMVTLAGLGTTLWQADIARRRLEERNVQLEIANEANGFLTRALSSIRPEIARGDELTLREFVEQVDRSMRADPPADPGVEASIRSTLGRSYQAVGSFRQAADHFRKSAQLREELYGLDDERTMESLNDQNAALISLGANTELELRVEEVAETATRFFGDAHEVTLVARCNQAQVLMLATDYGAAAELYRNAIASYEVAEGAREDLIGAAKRELVATYMQTAESDRALVLLEEILASSPSDPMDPSRMLDEWLAIVLGFAYGRFEQSCEDGLELLGRVEQVMGKRHVMANSIQASIGHQLAKAGFAKRATPLLIDARDSWRMLGTEFSSDRVDSLVLTGQGFYELGRVDEAQELLEQALEAIARRADSVEVFRKYQAMECLANVFLLRGELDVAEAYLADAERGAREDLGPENFLTLLIRNNHAQVYAKQGRRAEAAAIWGEIAARAREIFGEDDPNQTLLFRYNSAMHLQELGEYARSEEILQDVLVRRERVLGPKHADVLVTRQSMAALYWRTERFEEALELMRPVAEDRLELVGPDHPHTKIVMQDLFGMLSARGYQAEAESWARRLEETRETSVE